ncbi:MAG: DUF5655 domain-containing protein [Actinomycetota bacterium]
MAAWTCPSCERSFGARGRSHVCTPGVGLDELLASAHPLTRPVFERIVDTIRTVDHDDELIIDPISKGVLLKRDAMFCMITPMKQWVAVGVTLGRKLDTDRISRKVASQGARHYHVFNVTSVEHIDDELLDWVVEAFGPTEAATSSSDPMVPDDVDIFAPHGGSQRDGP